MSNAKKSFTKVTTPLGVAGYTYLTVPDTKFKEEGEYRIQLTLKAHDYNTKLADLLANEIAKSVEEAKADPKNKGKKIREADLPIKELENGDFQLNIKCKAKVIGRKDGKVYDLKPVLFDAKGERISGDPKVGAGSKVKVNFEIRPYYTALVGAGISLSLKAVQIIKLESYGGGGNASQFGFDEEEGYEAAIENDEHAEQANQQAQSQADDDSNFDDDIPF